MSQKVLIIGATSAIAEATAKIFAQRGDQLYLLARNADRLEHLATDLKIRGADAAHYLQADVNDFANHATLLSEVKNKLGGIDIVLIAYGTLPNQQNCEQNFSATLQELNTNLISTISFLTLLANHFEQQKHGTLAVISSVAGDRGRQSNYVYGAAKGGLSIFLQGLRNRLFKSGVNVLTIKPGFVDTPMTANFKKGFLWATPEQIGQGIVKAIDKKSAVVYLPKFWCLIMFIIKLIPENIFKRLKL